MFVQAASIMNKQIIAGRFRLRQEASHFALRLLLVASRDRSTGQDLQKESQEQQLLPMPTKHVNGIKELLPNRVLRKKSYACLTVSAHMLSLMPLSAVKKHHTHS